MSHPQLDALVSAALDLRASDLHLIAGVPPAFRVNGDILFADYDALRPEETLEFSHAILSPDQQAHFEREWELCISLPHAAAGRIRATLYKRIVAEKEVFIQLKGFRLLSLLAHHDFARKARAATAP